MRSTGEVIFRVPVVTRFVVLRNAAFCDDLGRGRKRCVTTIGRVRSAHLERVCAGGQESRLMRGLQRGEVHKRKMLAETTSAWIAERRPCHERAIRKRARPSTRFARSGAPFDTRSLRSRVEWWAHQDSNLERAGYEPAALTVELWAQTIVLGKVQSAEGLGIVPRQTKHYARALCTLHRAAACERRSTLFVLLGMREACGCARDAAACAAPSPRSGGCVRA